MLHLLSFSSPLSSAGRILAVAALVACVLPEVSADELPSAAPAQGLGDIADHDHAPIHVRSRPVIERLPVNVVEPADLCVSTAGLVFVADARARVVFRIQADGTTDIAASDLDGIRRVLVDRDGTLFVLTASTGSGRIFHVSAAGHATELHTLNFAPCGFARTQSGEFVVSENNGRTVLVAMDGTQADLARASEKIVDVTLNTADQPHALLQSGRVIYLGLDGSSATAGYAPAAATRLFQLPEGQLAVLHQSGEERPMVRKVARTMQDLSAPAFAQVPLGTIAVAFDRLGNLCLANPDLRAVTKVTSRFVVPCPHCGRSLTMIFSTDPAEKPQAGHSRPF